MRSQEDERKQILVAELAGTLLEVVKSRRRSVTGQLLAKIKTEWLGVPAVYRPWGFWVREYRPLPADAAGVDFQAVPHRVWFYYNAGLRPENVWKWMRLVAVRTLATGVRGGKLGVSGPILTSHYKPFRGFGRHDAEIKA